jgi:hypothetical protein
MITVKYSCKLCGADKIELTVPARKDDEDVVDFVQETARLVGIHHSHRNCKGTTCDLMIPISDDGVLGHFTRPVKERPMVGRDPE